MEFEEAGKQMSDLTVRYVKDSVRLWQRCAEAVQDAGTDSESWLEMQRRMADFANDEGAKLMKTVVQLNVEYYSSLLEAGVRYSEGLLGAMSRGARSTTGDDRDRPPIELAFKGRSGEEPRLSFLVSNPKEEAAEVRFEVTEFLSHDGSSRVRVPIRFTPEAFELKPGEERVVECGVPLSDEFELQKRYEARVRVADFPSLAIALVVDRED